VSVNLKKKLSPCQVYGHTWVAGMFYVHYEDVRETARHRRVQCETCELVYRPDEEL
jgi:hypothetical protein